jgi:hypothetical protein
LLDLAVAIERAADEADRSGSGAVLLQPVDAGGDDLWMIRQSQVIVRAQDNDFAAAFDLCRRPERAGNGMKLLELARIRERLQQFAGAGIEVGVRHSSG